MIYWIIDFQVHHDQMCTRIPYDAVPDADGRYATETLLQQFQQNHIHNYNNDNNISMIYSIISFPGPLWSNVHTHTKNDTVPNAGMPRRHCFSSFSNIILTMIIIYKWFIESLIFRSTMTKCAHAYPTTQCPTQNTGMPRRHCFNNSHKIILIILNNNMLSQWFI